METASSIHTCSNRWELIYGLQGQSQATVMEYVREKQDMLTLSSCNSQTLMADMMVFPQAMTSSLTAFLNYGNTHLLENKGCGELQLRCGIMLAQQTGSPMILRSTL